MRFFLLLALFVGLPFWPVQAGELQNIRTAMTTKNVEALTTLVKAEYDRYQTGKISEIDFHDLLNAIGRSHAAQATTLTDWVTAKPESGLARLTRAYFLRHTAWLLVELNPTPKRIKQATAMMEGAYNDYLEAEKLLPKCPFCEHGAINIAQYMRSAEMVEDFMASALKDDPKTSVPYLAYEGALKRGMNGPNGYTELISSLVKTQPDNPYLKTVEASILRDRGEAAYDKLRNYPESLNLYLQSLKLHKFYDGYKGVAHAYWGLRDYDKALLAVNATLELFPTHWNALELRAAIYEKQSKTDLMLADLETAMALGHDASFGQLARIYSGLDPEHPTLKNEDKARKLCLRGAQDAGLPTAALCMAHNYYFGQNGYKRDIEQAVIWFMQAADGGVESAMVDVGIILWEGQGVSADKALACKYWKWAEQLESTRATQAMNNRGACKEPPKQTP
jgi:tetratricopeptide (TPR) repeat protein